MASILHRDLPEADLHECKGASTATIGQVLVATGQKTATFQTLPIPSRIKVYTTTASSGTFAVAPTGFTTVSAVHATVVAGAVVLGTAATANIASFSASSVVGSVIVHSAAGNSLGSTQTVLVTVIGT